MCKYLIIILISLTWISCSKNNEHKQEHAAHGGHGDTTHAHHGNPMVTDLMAVHDSIMLQMDEIMTLKKRIKNTDAALDSLAKEKPDPQLEKQKARAKELIERLDQADKSMMEWMHQYKADTLETLTANAQEAYIADQQSKIEMVRDHVRAAIAESKDFLKTEKL